MSPPFAALADPTRRRIIELLARGEQPVNRIARGFDMSRPAVSQHLRILLRAGLLHERRDGRERLYSLNPVAFRSVAEWADRFGALDRPRPAAGSTDPAPQPTRATAPSPPAPTRPPAPTAPRRPRIRSHRRDP